MFEASTARELSYHYRTFEQESQKVFDRIKEFCKLGRYTCMLTVKTLHLRELEDLLKHAGYHVKVIDRKSDHEDSTIIIKWEIK